MPQDTAEIIDLFGVKFTGKRDLSTGRIYVPCTAESRLALAELGKVGREMVRAESEGAHGVTPRSHRLSGDDSSVRK